MMRVQGPAATADGQMLADPVPVAAGVGAYTNLIVMQPSNASKTSDPFYAWNYGLLWFHITVDNTSTPAGSFKLQGSMDRVNFDDIYLDANKVYGQNFSNANAWNGGYSVAFSGPAGLVVIDFPIVGPPMWLQLVYTFSSLGTTGNRVNAGYAGKSM